eukprot:4135124-Ditylum_brightwellii.AAC.1
MHWGQKHEPPIVVKIHQRDVTLEKMCFRQMDGWTDGMTELLLLNIDTILSSCLEALCMYTCTWSNGSRNPSSYVSSSDLLAPALPVLERQPDEDSEYGSADTEN